MPTDARVNILLVDDRPENLFALRVLLEELGQNLVEARSGVEALRRVQEDDFALILMDIQMPNLDGLETARLIKLRARARRTPLLFLTAFEQGPAQIAQAYEVGAVDFLFKPLVPEILRAKVGVFVELYQKAEEVKRQGELLRAVERREHQRRLEEERQRWELVRLRQEKEQEHRAAEELARRAAELAGSIARRERAEAEMRRSHDELERRVAERTVALVEANRSLRQEVAERERAEQALRSSEERFRLLVEGVQDYALILLDPHGRVESWNAGAERIYGYRAEEVIGQPVARFFEDEDRRRGRPDEELREAAEAGRCEEEGWRVRRDGSRFWSHAVVTALRDEDGRLHGFAKITRDDTERKRAADESRLFNEELERRVGVRTSQLEAVNHELANQVAERRAAEEQLKASLREKEVLLREIHHRVKNNLQVISSLFHLQARYIKDEQALQMFRECQNRVQSMALVHEKLYRSKDLARIDFGGYVRSLAAHMFHSYGYRSGAVKLDVNVRDVFLGIDTLIPCALIINELVTNSLKYAFPDGREGTVGIDLQAAGPSRFLLTVRDDGVGFPAGLDFRAAPTLGLQIVTALTEQLDGTITLDRGGGTAFAIAFQEVKERERG